jgi:hypothetical protein
MPFQDQNFNSINQNLAEADVKFKLVKFCYIFFILNAINDILLKTVKNNIVACLCNVFYTNLFLWNTTIQYNTIQYNTDILFPIKEPFRAEQLTKNLIQWLWIDYIDWKMTTFYETRHHLTCVVLSHSTAGVHILRFHWDFFIFNYSQSQVIKLTSCLPMKYCWRWR